MCSSTFREQTTVYLAILLGLFIGRVLGQLIVVLYSPAFLPAFEHWQSGALPYPLLLLSQLLLIMLGIWAVRNVREGRDTRNNRSAMRRGCYLRVFSILYASLMVLRAFSYLMFSLGISAEPAMPGIIPIPFHFVVAGFIFTYASYLQGAEQSLHGKRIGKAHQGLRTLCSILLATATSACSLPAAYIEHKVRLPKQTQSSISTSEFTVERPGDIVLRGVVFKPKDVGKTPSILIRAPFPEGVKTELMIEGIGVSWARRGYAVVVQGTRGSLGSGGDPHDLFIHERADGLATLEWLKKQSFYNGELFTWGGSYFSYTQWAIADQLPADTGGIASHIGSSDFFDPLHPGGAFALESALFWALRNGWDLPSEKTLDNAALQWPATGNIPGVAPFIHTWAENTQRTAYWQQRKAVPAAESRVPVQILGGWFDPFLKQQLKDYASLLQSDSDKVARQTRLIIGPWGHAASAEMPEGFIPNDYRFASIEPALEWFDMVAGRRSENEIPPVRFFTTGINQWQTEETWPPANVRYVSAYLGHQGSANSSRGNGVLQFDMLRYQSAADHFVHDPKHLVPTKGGISLGNLFGMEKQNDIEKRADVLVYTSKELSQNVEISGTPRLSVRLSSSSCAADFVVKLVDVFPTGAAYNVSEGIVRFNACDESPGGLGKRNVTLELQPCSRVFFAGHRIRLQIAGSSFPQYDTNPAASGQTAVQQVFHGLKEGSRIELPMRPALIR